MRSSAGAHVTSIKVTVQLLHQFPRLALHFAEIMISYNKAMKKSLVSVVACLLLHIPMHVAFSALERLAVDSASQPSH